MNPFRTFFIWRRMAAVLGAVALACGRLSQFRGRMALARGRISQFPWRMAIFFCNLPNANSNSQAFIPPATLFFILIK